jgi:hypothetical protein
MSSAFLLRCNGQARQDLPLSRIVKHERAIRRGKPTGHRESGSRFVAKSLNCLPFL